MWLGAGRKPSSRSNSLLRISVWVWEAQLWRSTKRWEDLSGVREQPRPMMAWSGRCVYASGDEAEARLLTRSETADECSVRGGRRSGVLWEDSRAPMVTGDVTKGLLLRWSSDDDDDDGLGVFEGKLDNQTASCRSVTATVNLSEYKEVPGTDQPVGLWKSISKG